jgi:Family of unknown function (DUF6492)
LSQLRDPDPLSEPPHSSASTGIDVVIPVGPRDIEMLEHTLEGVNRNLAGPIGSVSCVTPPDVCVELSKRYPDITVVDERDICGPEMTDRLRHHFGMRAGWLIQQLLTLSTPEITDAEAALVIDADTVLLRPRRFRAGRTTLLLTEREFHIPYYEALGRLWREPVALPQFSCIAHHMCFLRDDVLAMRGAIEALWARPWFDAILECCDARESSTFSEYELYGQWRLKTAGATTLVRPARNVACQRPVNGHPVKSGAYSASYHWHIEQESINSSGHLTEKTA